MKTKRKILFLIPDGVGIRNFLYSNIIKYLKKDADIIFWSPLSKEAFKAVEELHDISIKHDPITVPKEPIFSRFYREASTYARLLYNSKLVNNDTIISNWRRPKNNKKLLLLFLLAEYKGKQLSKNYESILKYEKKAESSWQNSVINDFKIKLQKLNPDSIFITHQRVAGLMPICLAAKQLDITVNTAIYSWDNLPKARLAVQATNYLVWSEWMENEMKTYYPEINRDHVKLVGTPQFDFYFDEKHIISRKEFASKYNLDENKKWICFSGDDVMTSPFDPIFLNDVMEGIDKSEKKPQVIFRRCPVDFSDRYDAVLEKYKNSVISINPSWTNNLGGWKGYFPNFEDINLQVNLAYHCSGVINLGSTMAHDFATFNKPCLYLSYDPAYSEHWKTADIYNFQHFKSMKQLDAVGWINSKEEIGPLINKMLDHPDLIAKDRKKWMETIVLHPLENNSKLIAQTLLER